MRSISAIGKGGLVLIVWICMLAALAGALSSVQSGANGELGRLLGNPFWVASISLSISLALTVALGLFTRGAGVSAFTQLTQAPWWAWAGGLCGAIFVSAQPVAAPRLGAAVYIGITVTASAIASLILDHFGLLGFQHHPASVWRILGAALMVAGVSLIARF
jgi:transporter family-2 protein